MDQNKKKLIEEINVFVTKLFSENIDNRFAFHNINHTKNVVSSAIKIAQHYKISDDDKFALIAAALFHDSGFCDGIIEKHETRSKLIARHFLKNKVGDEIMKKILACIQSTRMPQKPSTLIEKIICDADLYHLGTAEFKELSQLLKKEREEYYHTKIRDDEWVKNDIEFLITHQYFTRYCQKNLEPVTLEWLQKLLASAQH